MNRGRSYRKKYDILVLLGLMFGFCIAHNLETDRRLSEDQQVRVTANAPSSWDWREHTVITPVKNQADCNAYYAFSTIAYFEQDLILNEGAPTSIDLSEQFLTTCLPNGGCVGGNPKDAMDLVLKKGGIPYQTNYPYSPYGKQAEDICYPSKQIKVGDRPMIGFFNLQDQQYLKTLILRQPLNIYICSTDLKSYAPTSNANRMLSCNADNLYTDHTVLLIGYTETEWIIKNSWGTSWGLGGFGYISRNKDNDCCIGSQIYLRGEKTVNKTQCNVKNCDVCVEANYCSKCKPGFFVQYKNSTHTCVQCNYANCAECENNVGYCKTCIYGYALYFPEQTCKVSTIENCKYIVNGGCKTCHDGYRVNANFTCENDCKIKDCEMCKDDKSCSKCKDGFKLLYVNNTLTCQQNKCKTQNCDTCDAKGKCLTCFGSYVVSEDSCVMKCDKPNCVRCSQTKNICAQCIPGYALDFYSHECTATTVANCNQTYLTKYCSICQQGHIRSDSWQSCDKICAVDNCKTCQVGYANQCVTCNQGYTLTVPEKEVIAICQKNNCTLENCTLCNYGGDTCVQCIDKYHVWNAWSKACIPYYCQLSNCAKCQTDSKKCEQCNDGFIPYLTTGGCIAKTIEHCVAMADSADGTGTECRDCETGYSVDYTTWKTCNRICKDSNCQDCSGSALWCKSCLDGYLLKSVSDTENKCMKIPTYMPNCLRSNPDQTVCYECKQFYYFDSKTKACVLNSGCPKDCLKCTGPNQDLKCECKSGFVWDFINAQCVLNPSDTQCLVISNYTGNPQCFQCKDGYTLTSDGSGCSSDCAVENCQTCVRSQAENYPNYCQICSEGYVANSNLTKCLACQVEHCKTCAGPSDLKKCTQCKIGYVLDENGTCNEIPCPQNSVFNGIECACVDKFYKDLVADECKSCTTSCKRCNSQTCLVCEDNFFLDETGKCSPCFENCEVCTDGKTCDVCQEGFTYQIEGGTNFCAKVGIGNVGYFVLRSGKKARCPAGCASCAKSQFSCQNCLKGYILVDEKCVKCSDNCQTCYENVIGACKTCPIGHILSSDGKCIKCTSSACTSCPVQANICVQCLPGYFVKDQTCKSCGVGCVDCTADGKCNSCKSGFALLQNGRCEQCMDGCSQCKADAMDKCAGGCLAGTFRDSEGKCINCPQICKSCESSNKCTECIFGYSLVDGVCKKRCSDMNCFECAADSDTCKECYAGYTLTDGKCVQDLVCNTQTVQDNSTTPAKTSQTDSSSADLNLITTKASCDTCPKNYFLASNFSCQKCTTTDQYCTGCTLASPSNCTSCVAGYYLSQNSTCSKCADNCDTCRTQDYCYFCSKGYYMVMVNEQYSGTCAKCHYACETCTDKPYNCLSCKQGFKLSVAGFCMSQDWIKLFVKLNMNFDLFSLECWKIRYGINMLFNNDNNQTSYYTQMISAKSGSTEVTGYVASQNSTSAFNALSASLSAGNPIAQHQVLYVNLIYNDKQFTSQKTNPDDGNKIKGWVIAVIVVGSIVGVILSAILIACIVKKCRSKEGQDKEDYSGKQTDSNLRKENPEMGM